MKKRARKRGAGGFGRAWALARAGVFRSAHLFYLRRGVWVFSFLVIVGCQTPKRLVSPISSSISDIRIPNAHIVDAERGPIVRGMVPYTLAEAQDLKNYGIKKILIFRNQAIKEVGIQEEMALLTSAGFSRNDITHIPFAWRDYTSFRVPCEQTIEALKFLREASSTQGSGVYFHCTVGEDRTGYLAGLYQLIYKKQDLDSVYQKEMCARGYAEGDHLKPPHVVQLVHENVTQQFAKMVAFIESGRLSADSLNVDVCERDPAQTLSGKKIIDRVQAQLKCH